MADLKKSYRITSINEQTSTASPGAAEPVRVVQVTAVPVYNSNPVSPAMPGAPAGAVTWTFSGDEAAAAASYFVVGEAYDNSFATAAA